MFDAKSRDEGVDDGYDKDEDEDDVVEGVRAALAGVVIDVHHSDDEEEDADNDLEVGYCSNKPAMQASRRPLPMQLHQQTKSMHGAKLL